MKILYAGSLYPGKTCLQRMVALVSLGHQVIAVNTESASRTAERSMPVRLFSRMGWSLDVTSANRQILQRIREEAFEVLWVDKGLTIAPATLRKVKQLRPDCRTVSYSLDDMWNPRNQSRRYLSSVPLYDVHVTTKSYNVDELRSIGARDVMFIGNAYDPDTHRPMVLSEEDRERWGASIGFVGGYELERHAILLELARAGYQVTVRCYTDEWSHVQRHENLSISQSETFGINYTKSIIASKINLCFLRKVNRDLQTSRSIEIPACGGFMLAERSTEHSELFEEGLEAEFFSDMVELRSKLDYYLTHDDERDAVARRGLDRCRRSGYSNQARLQAVLSRVRGLR